ncbi:ApeA N-terminal domain 1-containing protein [Cryobacterium tepidiphilum]|uniref:ApeA N-terminal domain 1-containing protein n=1 Tax=Cryobacterium tepidiphilum TaxID=2486026 RepID=UPI0011CD94AE|nr:hypothetical protein [Cryobacterium tepidiphilum]
MSIDKFEPGKSYSGVLLTYHDGSQHKFPATLRFDDELGVEIEVSDGSSSDSSIFAENRNHPSVWFRNSKHIPEQCIFESLAGSITLSKIRNTYRSENFRVTGARFVADEAVLVATRAAINEPALFDELVSHIDGLPELWNARNVVVNRHYTDNGLARRIEITTREDIPPIEWVQNGADMRIELSWRSSTSDSNRSWTLSQLTQLVSQFSEPRPADDHLDEHWKIKSLLTLLFGRPVAYREHAVSSHDAYFDELPTLHAGERKRFYPRHPFVTRRTVREFSAPLPKQNDFNDAIFWLNEVGAAGLQRWGEAWDANWERLISPTVSALSRPRPYVEDIILAAGIFLDAWGKQALKVDGERETYSKTQRSSPTFATYVYRALSVCEADWTGVTLSTAGLANAIRAIYTGVKHAEKRQPDPTQMILISDVMLLIVRMIAARKVDNDGAFVKRFGYDWSMKKELQGFKNLDFIIDEGGNFVSSAAAGTNIVVPDT